jgi:hypothetical protein
VNLDEFESSTEVPDLDADSLRPRCAALSTARGARVSILLLVVAYLPLALTFSFLTPAFEGDDEGAHTQYIEYIMSHGSIPRIGVASSESQQPPLYYLLAAGWQHLLAIPAFTPQFSIAKNLGPNDWTVSRSRTPAEHQEAVYVHELRLLSILLGLGTVLLAYAAAKVIKLRELVCLACGLFVALLPRELVVSSNVTNDALATPLCALALVLFLLSESARHEERFRHRRVDLGFMGLTLGLAAATKFTTLPIAGILLLLAALPSVRLGHRALPRSSVNVRETSKSFVIFDGRRLVDAVIAAVGFLAASGWWFVRNKELYGQFLASNSSEKSLGVFAYPVPWTAHLFFVELPRVLWQSTWYAQLLLELPNYMNDVLALLAVVCLVVGAWVVLARPMQMSVGLQGLSGVALLGCMVGGLVTEVFHIKTTSIGDSRLAFVCLTASAVVLIAGSTRIASRINIRLWPVGLFAWPVIFLLLDVYVLLRFLIPLGGL